MVLAFFPFPFWRQPFRWRTGFLDSRKSSSSFLVLRSWLRFPVDGQPSVPPIGPSPPLFSSNAKAFLQKNPPRLLYFHGFSPPPFNLPLRLTVSSAILSWVPLTGRCSFSDCQAVPPQVQASLPPYDSHNLNTPSPYFTHHSPNLLPPATCSAAQQPKFSLPGSPPPSFPFFPPISDPMSFPLSFCACSFPLRGLSYSDIKVLCSSSFLVLGGPSVSVFCTFFFSFLFCL